ncbi:ATP-binding protein [Peribacillus frigoritolerans]|uniref:ATP-binding protein n=1 Tax=Peribacillus frigoritolerans TaxID=450367 RepID=UPI0025A124BB|nr:ATP-binding protein [Peribacillus frigoritolerans]MDM5310347.1 ATP-binding protein [Peribacillus frigoritolerans]
MQAIKRFPKCEDVYKDIVKKLVPKLADRDDFEAEYQYKLPCSSCREETAIGLFYRILNQEDWYAASETMECSVCRDREAFNVNQSKSLEELRASISERLTNEYFLLPEDLMDAGFKNFEKTNDVSSKAKEEAMSYTKMFLAGDQYNLLIMGNPGTGKSHLCTAIARTIKETGCSVGFLTTGKLLSIIKTAYSKGAAKSEEDILRDIKKIDLLVLDDVGSEAIGGNDNWRKGMIFEIVECRSGKPTIYTTNLTDTVLPVAVGDRVFSRLYKNTKFIDLFIENYDYRKKLQIH